MKIISVIGARPQFVKEAIMQRGFKKHNDIIEVVVHTGQHFDSNMSGIFFEDFKMEAPKYELNINNKSPVTMIAEMMIEMEKIIQIEKPDYVLLYGDTNSTLAGALSARKMNVKVIHVEAGLRQEPKDMPEEINRVLTDHSSHLLFTPSLHSVENLKKEGISKNVFNVGDIMYDLFLETEKQIDLKEHLKYGLVENEYIVLTMHRDFNVDDKHKLKSILIELKKINKQIQIIFPIHPRTKNKITEFGLKDYIKDMVVIEPIPYVELLGLAKNSFKIITDSGGFQKESYFLNKKASVLMPDTAWIELIDHGINTLVNSENIFEITLKPDNKEFMINIYGEGDAVDKIIKTIKKDYKMEKERI